MECRKRLKAGKCQSQEQSIVEIMSQPRRRPLEATSHICGAQQHNQEEAWPLFTPPTISQEIHQKPSKISNIYHKKQLTFSELQ